MKRLISLILVLAMIMSFTPSVVYADGVNHNSNTTSSGQTGTGSGTMTYKNTGYRMYIIDRNTGERVSNVVDVVYEYDQHMDLTRSPNHVCSITTCTNPKHSHVYINSKFEATDEKTFNGGLSFYTNNRKERINNYGAVDDLGLGYTLSSIKYLYEELELEGDWVTPLGNKNGSYLMAFGTEFLQFIVDNAGVSYVEEGVIKPTGSTGTVVNPGATSNNSSGNRNIIFRDSYGVSYGSVGAVKIALASLYNNTWKMLYETEAKNYTRNQALALCILTVEAKVNDIVRNTDGLTSQDHSNLLVALGSVKTTEQHNVPHTGWKVTSSSTTNGSGNTSSGTVQKPNDNPPGKVWPAFSTVARAELVEDTEEDEYIDSLFTVAYADDGINTEVQDTTLPLDSNKNLYKIINANLNDSTENPDFLFKINVSKVKGEGTGASIADPLYGYSKTKPTATNPAHYSNIQTMYDYNLTFCVEPLFWVRPAMAGGAYADSGYWFYGTLHNYATTVPNQFKQDQTGYGSNYGEVLNNRLVNSFTIGTSVTTLLGKEDLSINNKLIVNAVQSDYSKWIWYNEIASAEYDPPSGIVIRNGWAINAFSFGTNMGSTYSYTDKSGWPEDPETYISPIPAPEAPLVTKAEETAEDYHKRTINIVKIYTDDEDSANVTSAVTIREKSIPKVEIQSEAEWVVKDWFTSTDFVDYTEVTAVNDDPNIHYKYWYSDATNESSTNMYKKDAGTLGVPDNYDGGDLEMVGDAWQSLMNMVGKGTVSVTTGKNWATEIENDSTTGIRNYDYSHLTGQVAGQTIETAIFNIYCSCDDEAHLADTTLYIHLVRRPDVPVTHTYDPYYPTEPTEPTEPVDPTEPTVPVIPDDPDPTDPDEPIIPDDPVIPVDPNPTEPPEPNPNPEPGPAPDPKTDPNPEYPYDPYDDTTLHYNIVKVYQERIVGGINDGLTTHIGTFIRTDTYPVIDIEDEYDTTQYKVTEWKVSEEFNCNENSSWDSPEISGVPIAKDGNGEDRKGKSPGRVSVMDSADSNKTMTLYVLLENIIDDRKPNAPEDDELKISESQLTIPVYGDSSMTGANWSGYSLRLELDEVPRNNHCHRDHSYTVTVPTDPPDPDDPTDPDATAPTETYYDPCNCNYTYSRTSTRGDNTISVIFGLDTGNRDSLNMKAFADKLHSGAADAFKYKMFGSATQSGPGGTVTINVSDMTNITNDANTITFDSNPYNSMGVSFIGTLSRAVTGDKVYLAKYKSGDMDRTSYNMVSTLFTPKDTLSTGNNRTSNGTSSKRFNVYLGIVGGDLTTTAVCSYNGCGRSNRAVQQMAEMISGSVKLSGTVKVETYAGKDNSNKVANSRPDNSGLSFSIATVDRNGSAVYVTPTTGHTYFSTTNPSSSGFSFYPYLRMSYLTTDEATAFSGISMLYAADPGESGTRTVYVLSDNKSTIVPNNAVVAGWVSNASNTSGNYGLKMTSTQWSLNASATNGDGWRQKNQVLPGGALYQLTTDQDSESWVGTTTYTTVINPDDSNWISNAADFSIARAANENSNYFASVKSSLDDLHFVQWVGTDTTATNAWDSTKKVALNSSSIDLGVLSDDLRGNNPSSDSKYSWVNNSDKVDSSDLNITKEIYTSKIYKGFTDDLGNVYVLAVTINNKILTESDINVVIDALEDVNGSSLSVSNSFNVNGLTATVKAHKIAYKYENITDSAVQDRLRSAGLLQLDERTKFITNLFASVERNTGNDTNAIWSTKTTTSGSNIIDGRWYNEAFDGYYMIEQTASYRLGLNDPSIRVKVLDPNLCPKKESTGNVYTKAFISQFRLSSIDNLGTFYGMAVELDDIENMLISRPFYIPNATVQDLS